MQRRTSRQSPEISSPTGQPPAPADTARPASSHTPHAEIFQTAVEITRAAVIEIDAASRLVYVNPGWEQMTGYSAAESLNQPVFAFIVPQFIPECIESFQKILGDPASVCHHATRLLARTGDFLDIEIAAHRIDHQPGQPASILAVLTNVTGFKQAEQALRLSEERYGRAIESSQTAIWDWDITTGQMYLSPNLVTLLGYQVEDVPEKISIWRRFAHPEDQPRLWQAFRSNLSGDSASFEVEHRLRNRANQYQWFITRGVIARDEHGTPLRLAGTLTEITQLKTTQAALRAAFEAEKRQRKLAESLQHISGTLNASLDYNAVQDHLLQQLRLLVPFDAAVLMLVDGGIARVARVMGYEQLEVGLRARVQRVEFDIQATPNLRSMAASGQPLVINNTRTNPDWVDRGFSGPLAAWIGAPLLTRGEQVIGFFSLEKIEPDYYTPEHLQALGAFTSQAALALENARLYAELSEHLHHEQRLNDLSYTISTAQDLSELLDTLVRLSTELVGADSGVLLMLNEAQTEIDAIHQYQFPISMRTLNLAKRRAVGWQVATSGESVILDEYRTHPAAIPEIVKAGVESAMIVPISAGNARLGALGLFSLTKPRKFTSRDLNLAQLAARQASVAIQKVRLITAQQNRVEELEALRATLHDISAELDLSSLLKSILRRAVHLLKAFGGDLGLYEPETGQLVIAASYRMGRDYTGTRMQSGEGIMGRVAQTLQPLIVDDYLMWEGRSPQYTQGPWRAVMAVPLIAGGALVGVISVVDHNPVRNFIEKEQVLLGMFGQQAAIAIQNARLFDATQRLATTDPLTGIFNRRHYFILAEREYQRALRYQHPLSLIMFDIDRFKSINDTYGHQAGDQVLQMITAACRKIIREVDIFGRYGGEEFVILLPETGAAAALNAAERIRTALANLEFTGLPAERRVTLSQGVTELDAGCERLDHLLARADQALYTSKQAGGDQITLWSH